MSSFHGLRQCCLTGTLLRQFISSVIQKWARVGRNPQLHSAPVSADLLKGSLEVVKFSTSYSLKESKRVCQEDHLRTLMFCVADDAGSKIILYG